MWPVIILNILKLVVRYPQGMVGRVSVQVFKFCDRKFSQISNNDWLKLEGM